MYDIIIVNGKKESFIKINENKLEGFNLLNGVMSNLTDEELQIVNSIKMSNNTTYLGEWEGLDTYLDNNSGLKHFFKDGIEDIQKFCEYNMEDGLLYDNEEQKNQSNDSNKKIIFKILLKNGVVGLIGGTVIGIILLPITGFIADEIYTSYYNSKKSDPFTYEKAYEYIMENEILDNEDKMLYGNEKLLRDVIPYYNGTNMDYIATTCFDELHHKYFIKDKENVAYYNILIPDEINLKKGLSPEEEIDAKCHEYIHLLQYRHGYFYLKEACAEIISYEYYGCCSIASYKNAVKNTKILIEIVGPEAIWKLNFSGDDSDLVTIIEQNLDSEKAKRLMKLLKTEPDKIENMDEEIETLLEELYYNIYQTNMNENVYISHILEDRLIGRYYFNSDKILESNPCYLEGKDTYDIQKELSYEEYLEALNENDGIKIKKVWLDESLNGTMPIEEAMQLGKLKIYFENEVWGLTEEQMRELVSDGYKIQFHGTLNVPKEIIESFEKNPNDAEYRESISNFYEIKTLPNIYETFPNDSIEKNTLE